MENMIASFEKETEKMLCEKTKSKEKIENSLLFDRLLIAQHKQAKRKSR